MIFLLKRFLILSYMSDFVHYSNKALNNNYRMSKNYLTAIDAKNE